MRPNDTYTWRRHHMETFSALLALCAVTSEFPSQRPVTRSLIFSFICAWINGWVNNHEACDLRCHRAQYNGIAMYASINQAIIRSDNDMSPVRRQVSIWTTDDLLTIDPLGTNSIYFFYRDTQNWHTKKDMKVSTVSIVVISIFVTADSGLNPPKR